MILKRENLIALVMDNDKRNAETKTFKQRIADAKITIGRYKVREPKKYHVSIVS